MENDSLAFIGDKHTLYNELSTYLENDIFCHLYNEDSGLLCESLNDLVSPMLVMSLSGAS